MESAQPRRTVALEPRTEFRFETDDGASVSITLVAGAAEVFGAEMVINRSYSFTDAQQVCLRRSIPGSPRSSTRLLSPSTRLVRHRPSSRGVAAHSTCTGPAGIRMCHLTVTSVVHSASTHPDCRPALHIDPACEHTSRRRRLRRWPPRLPWRATCNCTRSWRSAARGQRRKAPTGRAG